MLNLELYGEIDMTGDMYLIYVSLILNSQVSNIIEWVCGLKYFIDKKRQNFHFM